MAWRCANRPNIPREQRQPFYAWIRDRMLARELRCIEYLRVDVDQLYAHWRANLTTAAPAGSKQA